MCLYVEKSVGLLRLDLHCAVIRGSFITQWNESGQCTYNTHGFYPKVVRVRLITAWTRTFSNNTVHSWSSQLSDDIKVEVIQEIKRAELFSIQLDESPDVQFCSQILAFVRSFHDEDVIKEFLFCQPLEQSTKGEDVMQKLTEFFESEDLDWGNLCWICTDGAPAMLGSQSGFFTKSYT